MDAVFITSNAGFVSISTNVVKNKPWGKWQPTRTQVSFENKTKWFQSMWKIQIGSSASALVLKIIKSLTPPCRVDGFLSTHQIFIFTLPSTMVLYFSKEIHFFQGDLRKRHQFWKESSQGRSSKLHQNCSKRSYSNTQNGSWISTTPQPTTSFEHTIIPSTPPPKKKMSHVLRPLIFFQSGDYHPNVLRSRMSLFPPSEAMASTSMETILPWSDGGQILKSDSGKILLQTWPTWGFLGFL